MLMILQNWVKSIKKKRSINNCINMIRVPIFKYNSSLEVPLGNMFEPLLCNAYFNDILHLIHIGDQDQLVATVEAKNQVLVMVWPWCHPWQITLVSHKSNYSTCTESLSGAMFDLETRLPKTESENLGLKINEHLRPIKWIKKTCTTQFALHRRGPGGTTLSRSAVLSFLN